jgi:hypothetical protein
MDGLWPAISHTQTIARAPTLQGAQINTHNLAGHHQSCAVLVGKRNISS